jgi:hypothetical protein
MASVAPGAPVGDLHEREALRLGTDRRVDLREAGLGLAQVDPDDLLDASGLGVRMISAICLPYTVGSSL